MNNIYAQTAVPSATPTVVASLTVPARGGYSVKGILATAEVDTFVEVVISLSVVSAGYITGASPNLKLDFSSSPYGLIAGQTILVRATSVLAGTHNVYTTLLVEQL